MQRRILPASGTNISARKKEGSRKLTYSLSAKGTPYVVLAGIYDDKAAIKELSKLTSEK